MHKVSAHKLSVGKSNGVILLVVVGVSLLFDVRGRAQEFYEEPRPNSIAQDAKDYAALLLAQYSEISASGNVDIYNDFRLNTLVPAIRRISEVAQETADKDVLYSAMALASLDHYSQERGSVWGGDLNRAMDSFPLEDVDDAFEKLEPEVRLILQHSVLRRDFRTEGLRNKLSELDSLKNIQANPNGSGEVVYEGGVEAMALDAQQQWDGGN